MTCHIEVPASILYFNFEFASKKLITVEIKYFSNVRLKALLLGLLLVAVSAELVKEGIRVSQRILTRLIYVLLLL